MRSVLPSSPCRSSRPHPCSKRDDNHQDDCVLCLPTRGRIDDHHDIHTLCSPRTPTTGCEWMILRPSGVMNFGSFFDSQENKTRHSTTMTMVVTQRPWGVDLPPPSPTNPRDLQYKYSAGGFNVLPACLVFMTVGMSTVNGSMGGNRTGLVIEIIMTADDRTVRYTNCQSR
jgi:hypothetical protein